MCLRIEGHDFSFLSSPNHPPLRNSVQHWGEVEGGSWTAVARASVVVWTLSIYDGSGEGLRGDGGIEDLKWG